MGQDPLQLHVSPGAQEACRAALNSLEEEMQQEGGKQAPDSHLGIAGHDEVLKEKVLGLTSLTFRYAFV